MSIVLPLRPGPSYTTSAVLFLSPVSDSGAGQLGWSLLEEYSRAGRGSEILRSGDPEMSQAADPSTRWIEGFLCEDQMDRYADMLIDMLIDMLSILVTALDICRHL